MELATAADHYSVRGGALHRRRPSDNLPDRCIRGSADLTQDPPKRTLMVVSCARGHRRRIPRGRRRRILSVWAPNGRPPRTRASASSPARARQRTHPKRAAVGAFPAIFPTVVFRARRRWCPLCERLRRTLSQRTSIGVQPAKGHRQMHPRERRPPPDSPKRTSMVVPTCAAIGVVSSAGGRQTVTPPHARASASSPARVRRRTHPQARGRRGLPREYVNGSLPRAAPSVSSLRAPETDVVPAHEHRHPTRESAPADASAGAPTYPRLPQENADGCPPCARPSTLYPQRVGAKRTSPPRTSIGVLPRESAPTDASKARGRQGLPREVISRTDAFAGASTSPKTPPRER